MVNENGSSSGVDIPSEVQILLQLGDKFGLSI